MSIVEVTGPDEEPITLEQAKAFARIETTAEDELIDGLIRSARRFCENATNRAFVTQTWDLFLNCFPRHGCAIEIPKPPLQSVTSIAYVDESGASQTWGSANYQVDARREPGIILPVDGVSYPTTKRQLNAVTIRFVAGYGDALAVPETLRHAIKILTSHWYDNRGPAAFGVSVANVPLGVEALLSDEALIRF